MTYVVQEECIKCKHQDCVAVCPVDCFYEGENMLVINPDECIDCAVCVPECPVDAIVADDESTPFWINLNAELAEAWKDNQITEIGLVPEDAAEWKGVPNKIELLIR